MREELYVFLPATEGYIFRIPKEQDTKYFTFYEGAGEYHISISFLMRSSTGG